MERNSGPTFVTIASYTEAQIELSGGTDRKENVVSPPMWRRGLKIDAEAYNK